MGGDLNMHKTKQHVLENGAQEIDAKPAQAHEATPTQKK